MNLFINAISQNWILALLDKERKIISSLEINILWQESSKLIQVINNFLKENNIIYDNLGNIILVNWPWSFTAIRTIILVVNTINFITKKDLTDLNFFDLYENYPIVKSSSKRDLFVKLNEDSCIEVFSNEKFLEYIERNQIEKIYWDLWNNIIFEKIQKKVVNNINYDKIIKNLVFKNKKILEPLYIKKPSIC